MTFFAKQEALRTAARAALNAEAGHEIVLPCPTEPDARSLDTCMDYEFKLTEKNYQAYTHALSSLLQLGTTPDIPNPPGIGKDFDRTESRWTAYRDSQCRIAASGSLHSSSYSICQQKLTRNHLHELADLFGSYWQ